MSNKQLLSVSAEYKPAGDQPEAINSIVKKRNVKLKLVLNLIILK